jgi:hypothetical protein
MIADSHIQQIGRLMLRYFEGNQFAAAAWFKKTWKIDDPRDLGTTERAGQVIRTLKAMLARRDQSPERNRRDAVPAEALGE